MLRAPKTVRRMLLPRVGIGCRVSQVIQQARTRARRSRWVSSSASTTRAFGQRGDLVTDVRADGVVVGVDFGDQPGRGPAGLFMDTPIAGPQAYSRPSHVPP